MNKNASFIETKEYRRYTEFCEACIKYKYIGLCYGAPGVGKTLSSRHYSDWDNVERQMKFLNEKDILDNVTDKILTAHTIFYTAPASRPSRLTEQIRYLGHLLHRTKERYCAKKYNIEEDYSNYDAFSGIDLIIVDEIDRLKLQQLEQLRDIYDQNGVALVLIGMPGTEKKLARFPQLYSRIGFAHEFDKLSKVETQHILEYKWAELGVDIKLEDFSDYESIASVIKITGGNFRLIHRLFTQIDRILKINNLQKINVDVVEAARDSLIIGI